jgi:PAS domain S-box-containing protein
MSGPAGGGFLSGLRVRLFLLVALAVAPALIVIMRAGAQARDTALGHADESAARLAQLAAVQGNQALCDAAPYVEALVRIPVLREGDVEAQNELFRRVLAEVPLYANAGMIAPDGLIRASALPFDPKLSLADRGYFQRALTVDQPTLGRCQFGRISKEPSINMARVVKDDSGAVKGVVYVAIRLDWLPRFGAQAKLPADAAITLLDDEGVVIARFPDPEGLTQKKMPDAPLVRAVLAAGEGRASVADLSGTVRPHAWAPLRWGDVPTGSFIAVGVSAAEEIAAADRAQRWSLVALSAAAVLALVVAWIAGDLLVVRRARQLVAVAKRIESGSLDARVGSPHGRGELGDIARAMDSMAEALEKRDRELRRAEARYRSLVEQTPAVFYNAATDSAARTVYCGPGVKKLLGFASEEWRGDPQLWSKRLHDEDRVRVAVEYGRAVAAGGSFALEYRLNGRDGAPVWVRDSGTVRAGADGSPVVTGLIVDVTEVKDLHSKLLRKHQFEAAARLASAVAREVDDAAASVRRHAVSLQPTAEADAKSRGHVDGVLRALDRVAALTRRLASFGGGIELAPEIFDASAAVQRLMPEFRRIAGEGADVVALPVPGETYVSADRKLFDETMLRIAALAKKAMPAGGHLLVGTATIDVGEELACRYAGSRVGQFVIAFVGESGEGGAAAAAKCIIDLEAGAPPATREAALEAAAALGFALQSGGFADVVTAAGRGMTYRLFLPKADPGAPAR